MPEGIDDFERMWADLAPVGRSASSGGYFRQPWLSAERELAAWFEEQCAARGLAVSRDAVGNMVAWWGSPGPGAVVTGSHLDSVLDGGAYDGPLGVVSALAAVDVLRVAGVRAVAAAGRLGVRGGGGVAVRAGLPGVAAGDGRGVVGDGARAEGPVRGRSSSDGLSSAGLSGSPDRALLEGVGTFVELHVEQGRDLVDRSAAVGVASGIWPHGRYRYEFTGSADHAGTTRMEDRADPMLTYAMTALAANKQARLAGERATFGRLEVTPNSTNSVPSGVTAWLDARASSARSLEDLVGAIERQASERASRDGTSLVVTPESVSGSV